MSTIGKLRKTIQKKRKSVSEVSCLVYWNRHKKCWSVKFTAEPIKHKRAFWAAKISFVVHQKGRTRAIVSGVRNVHAFIKCKIVKKPLTKLAKYVTLTYSPFCPFANSFYAINKKGTRTPMPVITHCHFTKDGHVYGYYI